MIKKEKILEIEGCGVEFLWGFGFVVGFLVGVVGLVGLKS